MALFDQIRKLISPDTPSAPAVSVRELNQAATTTPAKALPRLEQSPVGRAAIELTPEFQTALSTIARPTPVVFVTGRAGTGKSTFITVLRENYDGVMAVVAPTGIAALNARGQTIHSFFHLPPRLIGRDDIKQVRDTTLYERLSLLVIDEVSMVRVDILDAIDRFLRANRPGREGPFAGVKAVLVGDLFQLPPVVGPAERTHLEREYDSEFFFSSHCLQQASMAAVELTKVFRQTESRFVEMLSCIREGTNLEATIAALNSECTRQDFDPATVMTLTPTRDQAASINARRLQDLPGEPVEFQGVVSAEFLNAQERNQLGEAAVDQKLPAPYRLALKVGARVMFTKNDADGRWVNGTTGTVVDLDKDVVRVHVPRATGGPPSPPYDVPRETWERVRYEVDRAQDKIVASVVGTYRQFPLMLAWAVTIHKAQGLTLSDVVVDLGHGAFAPGQTYVALSRCRSLGGLRLQRPLRLGDVRRDARIARFYAGIRQATSR